jgi:hypothetical protein
MLTKPVVTRSGVAVNGCPRRFVVLAVYLIVEAMVPAVSVVDQLPFVSVVCCSAQAPEARC